MMIVIVVNIYMGMCLAEQRAGQRYEHGVLPFVGEETCISETVRINSKNTRLQCFGKRKGFFSPLFKLIKQVEQYLHEGIATVEIGKGQHSNGN